MEILKLNSRKMASAIKEAASVIEQGKVILCPSDTVYGLLCDAHNKKAVLSIFKLKKRPKQKVLPVFVKDIKMAKGLAYVNKKQEATLEKVWPGKTTVVLKSKRSIPGVTLRGTIGMRLPRYRFLRELLKKIDRPLAQTSANISAKPASTKIGEVFRQFQKTKNQPHLILDAGNLKLSLSSTVLDLTSKKIKVLRKGATEFKTKVM